MSGTISNPLPQPSSVPFQFGSFDYFCNQIAMPLCPLVGASPIEPQCYARNIELAGGTLLFEPATLVIHLIALIMTGIMIYHIKSKYTAVGRKEIVTFFYLYALTTICEFFVVSGIIPLASGAYPYVVAGYQGLVVATLWSLLFNGFVGFQWIEDGTPLSLWSLRLSAIAMFLIGYAFSILTFQSRASFASSQPFALFVVYFIVCGAFILVYAVTQVILVVNTLDDRWPLGDLMFGLVFFTIGQVFQYTLSVRVCNAANHYVDGIFFGAICNLLGAMMVYKFWDSITKEDLEFAVGGKANVWEVKDPLLSPSGGPIN